MARPVKLPKGSLTIAVTYVVQSLGDSKKSEIAEKLRKLGISVDDIELRDVLDGLKKRGFIAENQKPGSDGSSNYHYSMRNMAFAKTPEVAHYKELLNAVTNDPMAQKIKEAFDVMETGGPLNLPHQNGKKSKKGEKNDKGNGNGNGDETEDDKEGTGPKGGRKAVYRDSHLYSAVYITDEKIYGGTMMTPSLKTLMDASPFKVKVDEDSKISCFFERDKGGGLMVHAAAVRGWFSKPLPRYTEHSESVGRNHCSFRSVLIYPHEGQLTFTTLPVAPYDGKPSAPQTYETLMPGVVMVVRFAAPTTGFMKPKDMEQYMKILGPYAPRKLSPARGSQSGKMTMIAFQDHGPMLQCGFKTDDELDREIEEMPRPQGRRTRAQAST